MQTKKSLLFISCEEAKHICDKAQYEEASFFDKIKLKIRVLWCHVSRDHSKRNTRLTEILDKADLKYLTPECKENMKQELDKAIKEHDSN